jgi:hypothetical protein
MRMSASGPDRSSNAFGAQSLSAGLSKNIAASGGLGNTRATPVGRPTTDLGRVAGMLSRGTARPGQVQGALMMERAQEKQMASDALNQMSQPQPAAPSPLATAAGAMGVSTPAPAPAPTPPVVPLAAPPTVGTNLVGDAASLTPKVGTLNAPIGQGVNPLLPKKPNALLGAANQMGFSYAPSPLY